MQQALQSQDLATAIREEIESKELQLPTLPEVALKVRDVVESDSADAAQVADLVSQDPALAARLVQVANSPLYRGRVAIENVQMAITRMGLNLVKNLIVSLAMKQIFQATSDALDAAFRKVWEDSIEVAAIARVLASHVDGLEPDQAMLAGLLHNIGSLPILTKLDHDYGFDADPAMVKRYTEELSPEIGCLILENWHFAEVLRRVPCDCIDLNRDSARVDYADLVLVARLQHLMASGRADENTTMERWADYPAFAKAGLETEEIILDVDGPAEQIAQVRDMLSS
jgi:HD-like signal output (HDOD) protein